MLVPFVAGRNSVKARSGLGADTRDQGVAKRCISRRIFGLDRSIYLFCSYDRIYRYGDPMRKIFKCLKNSHNNIENV